MEQSEKTLDMIVNLCKNRGYVFPGSEIYGGLANSWDYWAPLGWSSRTTSKGMAEKVCAAKPPIMWVWMLPSS